MLFFEEEKVVVTKILNYSAFKILGGIFIVLEVLGQIKYYFY